MKYLYVGYRYNKEIAKRIFTVLDKSEVADVYKIGAYCEIKIVEQETHPGYNSIALLYHNKAIFVIAETIDGAWETEKS